MERWSVKTGTDADAGLINLASATSSTIASLGALPAPSSLPSNNRVQPTETTVFRIGATLTEFKLEADSDYHLALSDGAGHTMISEIPDPACVGASSRLLSRIQTARGEFDAKYTPTGTFHVVNVPVTVTGVGFFDFLHGQTGVAPNGIELHTVTDIQFGSGGGSNSASEPPHAGSWDAWLNGYGTTHTDTLSQPVSIPAGCTAALAFWLHIDTAKITTSTAYDKLTVAVGTTTLATYSNLNHNTGYSPKTLNRQRSRGRR